MREPKVSHKTKLIAVFATWVPDRMEWVVHAQPLNFEAPTRMNDGNSNARVTSRRNVPLAARELASVLWSIPVSCVRVGETHYKHEEDANV